MFILNIPLNFNTNRSLSLNGVQKAVAFVLEKNLKLRVERIKAENITTYLFVKLRQIKRRWKGYLIWRDNPWRYQAFIFVGLYIPSPNTTKQDPLSTDWFLPHLLPSNSPDYPHSVPNYLTSRSHFREIKTTLQNVHQRNFYRSHSETFFPR